MKRPIAVDIFSGVGGLSLGFEQAGFRIAAAVDIDPINVEFHRKNFPRCKSIEANLAQMTTKELNSLASLGRQRLDVLIGGPPCQGFSLIGKRRPDDGRNLLVLSFADWVRRLKPRYFVMENVSGLLVGHANEVLGAFRRTIQRAGYNILEPIIVLNAADFGVPQRRLRAFILGYSKELPPLNYPDPVRLCDSNGKPYDPTVGDAIGDLPDIDTFSTLLRSDRFLGRLRSPSHYAGMMRGDFRDPQNRGRHKTINGEGLSGCLRTSHSTETVRRFRTTPQGEYEPKSRCFRLANCDLAPTLRAGTGPENGSFTAARPIHPLQARCISVREAARLHSFPDWFVFHPTKWHGFRQIGNSVPPLFARAVAASVLRSASRQR